MNTDTAMVVSKKLDKFEKTFMDMSNESRALYQAVTEYKTITLELIKEIESLQTRVTRLEQEL